MRYFVFLLLLMALLIGCQISKKSANQQSASPEQNKTGKKFSQVPLKLDYVLPTVGISS